MTLDGVLESIGRLKSVVFNILAVTKAGVVADVQFEYSDQHREVYGPYRPKYGFGGIDTGEHLVHQPYSPSTEVIITGGIVAACAVLLFTIASVTFYAIQKHYERRHHPTSRSPTPDFAGSPWMRSSSWDRLSSLIYSETAF